MGLVSELKKTWQAALDQITASAPSGYTGHRRAKDLTFTKNFYSKAKEYGLTEADARDVYNSGHLDKYKTKWLQDKMYKDYNGYRITICYFKDARTGQPVISSIWKTERGR